MHYVRAFIEHILAPDNLAPKQLNGKVLKVDDFVAFVGHFVDELRSGRYPPLRRLFDLCLDAANSDLVNACVKDYRSEMSELVSSDPRDPRDFKLCHDRLFKRLLKKFEDAARGDETTIRGARDNLDASIAEAREEFRKLNYDAYSAKRDGLIGNGAKGGATVGALGGVIAGASVGLQLGGAFGVVLGGAVGAVVLGAAGFATGMAIGAVRVAVPRLMSRLIRDHLGI